jgi:hypothetical protein
MRIRAGLIVTVAVLFVTAGAFPTVGGATVSSRSGGKATCTAPKQDQVTPVLMRVLNKPIPVKGSDRRYHLLYDIELINFGRSPTAIQQVEVLDVNGDKTVASLSGSDLAARMRTREETPGSLSPGAFGDLFMHVAFDTRGAIPAAVQHRLVVDAQPTPLTETAACTTVAKPTDLVLSPPLRGAHYLAGDGCCESLLHTGALLPIDGRPRLAQRFAIDWEQLDEQGRIYTGEQTDVNSYTIYGQQVHAVADARVVSVVNDQPLQVPGALPENLSIAQEDGNNVVLDLGDGRFALCAHMQPGSVRVKKGDKVRRGEVLGLVGNSGNTSAPHVHFHVMDSPSPLASNGVPYLMDRFSVSEQGVSTQAFRTAESMGTPLEVEPVQYPGTHRDELPLDLSVATFR